MAGADFINGTAISFLKDLRRIQSGFDFSVVRLAALINFLRPLYSLSVPYFFQVHLYKGLQLHAHVVKCGSRNHALFSNRLINFYSKSQRLDDSFRRDSRQIGNFVELGHLFFRPKRAPGAFSELNDVKPDDHIFPSAPEVERSTHSPALKTGFVFDVFVGSSLVDMYAKCNQIVDARKMFDEMPERNVVSWSGFIYGDTPNRVKM